MANLTHFAYLTHFDTVSILRSIIKFWCLFSLWSLVFQFWAELFHYLRNIRREEFKFIEKFQTVQLGRYEVDIVRESYGFTAFHPKMIILETSLCESSQSVVAQYHTDRGLWTFFHTLNRHFALLGVLCLGLCLQLFKSNFGIVEYLEDCFEKSLQQHTFKLFSDYTFCFCLPL